MEEQNEPDDFSSYKHPTFPQVIEELKELLAMVLPITAMNCLVYVRAVVSVLFLGRLGSLELAGGALSIGFTNITGYSVLVGLASGLEPVCSQAFGSKNWELLSLSLHRMVMILLIASVPIGLLWINLGPIMLFLGQDPEITATAAEYCHYALPDLLTNTLLQPLRVYLRSQRVTKPMMWCTLAAVAFHVPLNYWLVMVKRWGVPGVATASVVTNLIMVMLLVGYVWVSGKLQKRVSGSMAAATVVELVGNELGAGRPYKARLAANVALACAFVIGASNVAWTVVLKERWAGLFTGYEPLKVLVASVMPIVGLCELGNCPQTTGCGILRGTGRPTVGAHVNLGSFYFVGTPVAVGLAFWLKVGFSGLWFGLLSAQAACAVSILYAVLARTDWEGEAMRAMRMTSLEMRKVGKDEESSSLLDDRNRSDEKLGGVL
ncbi:hypothetical protein F2Q70_00015925 [Brassica cretica]|uniref:Protein DETOXIFICATION n=1 Tax=Brassica cretica TaxID=69181 RepID=A0A8S9I0R2_BRACR|nr:hypothetical protein F2Q70_00015925 [Brassica cretica]